MIAGAWICLLAPLCGAVAITLLGRSISRRTAAWISTVSVFTAFGGAVAASEVVVGLGLIVAIARRRLDLDVDRLRVLRG